jgi:hypothetical protein
MGAPSVPQLAQHLRGVSPLHRSRDLARLFAGIRARVCWLLLHSARGSFVGHLAPFTPDTMSVQQWREYRQQSGSRLPSFE